MLHKWVTWARRAGAVSTLLGRGNGQKPLKVVTRERQWCRTLKHSAVQRQLALVPANGNQNGDGDGSETDDSTATNHGTYMDTFTAYQRFINEAGFSRDQAEGLVNVITQILRHRERVVLSSMLTQAEAANNAYLFRCACDELRAEFQRSRRQIELQRVRSQRTTALQNDLDALSLRMAQEFISLRNSLRGMLEDHRDSVRSIHRSLDAQQHELTLKISLMLNSDAKLQVEKLRWILSRRAAAALALGIVWVFMGLRYYTLYYSTGTVKLPPAPTAAGAGEYNSVNKDKDMIE